MKPRLILLIIYTTIFSGAFAQKAIKGKVFDAVDNTPLPGANISFGGKGGTTTNKEGVFSVDCSKAGDITVSFVGYQTYTFKVKNCNEDLSIALVPTANKLNEVEITVTSNQNKTILHQPASINKLSKLELNRGLDLYLDDAINTNVPGVSMNRRAVSSGQQFNIRGYGNGVRGTNGANSNFDGQGYKVYLNGIPVTDAEGITVMDDIDFGSIGNVEITKGPAGTLYGLAISGVVNLKTIKPEKGHASLSQEVLIGSYGLQRYTTQYQLGKERSSFLINYGHQKSDGYMPHNASTKNFVNVFGDFTPNDKQAINVYFGYSKSYDERAGELTLEQYKNNDYSGNPNYIKNNAHSEVNGFRFGLGHTYTFCDNFSNTTSVFGTGLTTNASSAGGWTDKDPINFGLRSTFDTKFTLSKGYTLGGITGVETQQQRAQTIGYAMVADSNNLAGYNRIGAMRSNQFTISSTTSLFTEWTLSMPHDVSLTAGVGVSNMKIELNDRFYVATANRAPTQYSKTYNGLYSPHLAINKVFNEKVSLYASYSKGYKAPVSSYFYIPTTNQVNRNLKPEIGDQVEVGSKGALLHNRLSYQLALFHTVFSDKMYAVAVPLNSTTTAYTYIANGGKQDHKGVEALVKFSALQSARGFFKSIMPFANATYSDFEYDNFAFQRIKPGSGNLAVDTFNYDGNPVAGVAKFVGNVGVDIFMQYGLYANAVYSYKDGMPITSDNVNRTTSYSLVNAKVGIRRSLSKHFDIDAYFGANNITGTKYPIMVFINQLPDAYVPAAKNATYFGAINLKYNF